MKFAVYGTLKKGFGNNRLLANAKFLGEDVTSPEYTMYSLGGFPAVVPEGDTPITVEIYETDDQNVIDSVNRLEGFTGVKDHPNNWYNIKTVNTKYGPAEMFIFDNKPRSNYIVESGNWS